MIEQLVDQIEARFAEAVGVYRAGTPGCNSVLNATWLMEDDAPQPDGSLYVLPEYGGRVGTRGRLLRGVIQQDLSAYLCPRPQLRRRRRS